MCKYDLFQLAVFPTDTNERTEQTVSASKEKKNSAVEGLSEREQQKLQEAQTARRNNIVYAVVGVVCLAMLALVIVWQTGMIQRNATAVTVKGVDYPVADTQYYYNTTKQSVYNFYYSNLGIAPFDYATSTKAQVYNSETGETWYDFLLGQTMDTMATYDAVAAQAAAEGYTMSAESQEYLDSQLTELQSVWKTMGFDSLDAYIKANFGTYMTYDRFAELYTKTMLVNDYITHITSGFTYEDADYETYYKANADTLDDYTITQFVFQALVDSTDAEGNPIEMTEDERAAAMEEAKKAAKAKADEVLAKLEAGEDAEKLAETYAEDLFSYDIADVRVGSNVNSSYSEWAYDEARRAGDLTSAEYDSGSGYYYYYVARFEDRERNDTPTGNVRHILVAAEVDAGASQPTEAQYAEAKKKAEELLAQWKAGEGTEDSFAALAAENSADTGSAANGGLIGNINIHSGYIPEFTDWALASGRKAGDTGLVKNTGSSTKGWHIMYFVGAGDPVWKMSADAILRSEDYTAWEDSIMAGYEATSGMGLKFLQD